MAYRLSQRHNQLKNRLQGDDDSILFAIKKTSAIFFIFGVLSLLTSLFYGSDKKDVFNDTLTLPTKNDSKIIGPITVNEEGKIYSVTSQLITGSQWDWSFISGELLDSNKNSLFSFAMELYPQRGENSSSGTVDGLKYKTGKSFTTDFTIKNKGQYYLKFIQDAKPSGITAPKLSINIKTQQYSPVPHRKFAIILIIIGFILRFLPSNSNGRNKEKSKSTLMVGLFLLFLVMFNIIGAILIMIVIAIVKNYLEAKKYRVN